MPALSLRAKLLGLASLLLTLTAVVGLVSITKLSSVADLSDRQFTKSTEPLAELGVARAKLNENRAFSNNHILESTSAGRADVEAKIEKNTEQVNTSLAEVEKTLVSDEAKRTLATLRTSLNGLREQRTRLLEVSATQSDQAAYAFNQSNVVPAVGKVVDDFEKLFDSKVALAAAGAQKTQDTYGSAKTLILVLLLVSLLSGFGVAWWIAQGIRKGVADILDRLTMLKERCTTELQHAMRAMAEGDLTVEVTPVTPHITKISGDEIGEVAQAVNAVRDNTVGSVTAYNESRVALAELIGRVSTTAGLVSAASTQVATSSEEAGRAVGEIAHAVTDVASGAQRQVLALEKARTTSDDVAHTTAQSAATAQETAATAERARAATVEGQEAVQSATSAMSAVREASQQATEAIRELGAKNDRIGGIVDTITQIAEQTNLLALNAAIEAARAGDQGRGFAVVADEVRKLAEESQAAAGSIASLIGEIQSDTGRAVQVVEEGERRTHDGAATVERAREAFDSIGGSVDEVTAQVAQIAAAAERMAHAVQQVGGEIADVAAVAEESSAATQQVSASTEQTSASTQQIAASAQELAGNAQQLEELTRRFVLSA